MKSSCCNEMKGSLFSTGYLVGFLNANLGPSNLVVTPSKEKDEGKPSFKCKLYTFHRGLREAFLFLHFCIKHEQKN